MDILTIYSIVVTGDLDAGIPWLGMLGLQFITAIAAFRLDRVSLRPLWSLALQQFVYRQLLYLILMRAVGAALTGVALRWQTLHRTGAAAAHLRSAAPESVALASQLGDRSRPVARLGPDLPPGDPSHRGWPGHLRRSRHGRGRPPA